MNNTEEADNFFDQFIRDNLPTEIAAPHLEDDIDNLLNELEKLNTPPIKNLGTS